MVIATSGVDKISFNKIISSVSSTYSVSESKQYMDPTPSLSRLIRGLYIVNKDNAKSLIYEAMNFGTEIASIDFNAASITLKKSLPLIAGMTIGIFVSDTVYYVGSTALIFNPESMPSSWKPINGFLQGIIYTSDISKTSCYKISTDPA